MGLTIPSAYNPADFYLAQLGSQPKTNNICDYFESSTLNEELHKELDYIKYSANEGTLIFGVSTNIHGNIVLNYVNKNKH